MATTPGRAGRRAARRRARGGRAGPALLLLAAVALLPAAGCGRRSPPRKQDLSALQITRYRYNIDEEHKIARVVGEIANSGPTAVKEVAVTVTLRGRNGDSRGRNTILVTDIPARGVKVFSATVTTHGRERDVDLRLFPVGAQEETD